MRIEKHPGARRAFEGHGVALRREGDPPIPGEPFMSMAVAEAAVADLRAKLAAAEDRADGFEWSHTILKDLLDLRGEELAIGGGPGFKGRSEAAWRAAAEIFEP